MDFDESDDPREVAVPEPAIDPAPAAAPAPAAEPEPIDIEPEPDVVEPEPDVVEPEPVVVEPEPVIEPAPAVVIPEPDFDPAPVFEPEPVIAPEPEPHPVESVNAAARPKPAVIDVMAEKCAWKTDIPGTPVRNIISGISLNDRILFINTLFKGDAQAFQATIALFNSYETLDQAEAFIRSNYPGWNLESEVVYRFMMAVRRKLGR